MAYEAVALYNDGQSSTNNSASGTLPGTNGSLVVIGVVQNSGTNTTSIADTGDGGASNTGPNPWTLLSSPNPDVILNNTDVALWAKVLDTNDVGKTVTITSSGGGIRIPALAVALTGRDSTVADIVTARAQQTTAATTLAPAGATATAGDDVLNIFFTRVASATAISLTAPGGTEVLAGQSNTAMSGSPNYNVAATYLENVAAGAQGADVATFNEAVQGIVYTLAIKAAADQPPTCNAGADQAVQAWVPVTLTGTDSDVDGTIASRQWTQTAGTAVTLSGATTATATFQAPGTLNGDTLTFQYEVTDNGGLTGTDTVNVTVEMATERAVIGGVEVPMQMAAVIS